MWVRDHADTEDLSVQTEASSVYLDNERTLEHELGNGSMVSNIATINSGMEKVIDGTYDGAYESCKMYGRSLVNILNTPTVTIAFNNSWRELSPNRTLEIGKKYLAIYHVETNTLDGTIKDVFKYGDDQILWGISVVPIGGAGVFKRTFTTPHEIIQYNCYTDNSTTGSANVRCVLLEYQEGMENWDIPFFEGLCDVKAPILKNVGKNLYHTPSKEQEWDGARIKIHEGNTITYVPHSNNGIGMSTHCDFTTPIKAKPNTVFTYSMERLSGGNKNFTGTINNYIRVLFKNGEVTNIIPPDFMGSRFDEKIVKTFTFTDEMEAIIGVEPIGYSVGNLTSEVTLQFQLEMKDIPTSYEDYKSNILTTPEQVVLRKVGDVCDSYDALTGEHIQRIGEAVLNGSEGINLVDSVSNSTYLYFDFEGEFTGAKNSSFAICDRFTYVKGLYGDYQNVEGVVMGRDGWGSIRILASKLATPDVIGFKQWLSQNPVTVQYELATPVTTTIEPSTTPFAYENGHIILESGHEGQSLLPTFEYQTVVSRSGQVAMIDKTIQQHERKITLLEKMLVQNIIDIEYKNTLLALKLEINEVI